MRTRTASRLYCLVALVFASIAHGQSFIRCPLADIDGFEAAHKEAKKFVSNANTIDDLTKAEVYITAKKYVNEDGDTVDELFFKTNILDPPEKVNEAANSRYQDLLSKARGPKRAEILASKNEYMVLLKESVSHPLKATFGALPEGIDVPELLANLVGERARNAPDFRKIFREKIKVVIEEEAFDHAVLQNVDIGSPKNLFCVGRDRTQRPLRVVQNTAGQTENLIALGNGSLSTAHVYARLNNKGYPELAKKLKSVPFRKDQVTMLPLIIDDATQKLIATKIPPSQRVSLDLNNASSDRVRDVLRNNKGKTVFVLAHVEGGDLVTRSSAGKVLFRMKVDELRFVAQSEGVSVSLVGCNSAAASSIGLVANQTIKSTTAVTRFADALEANNYFEFYSRFSAADLGLVVNDVVVKPSTRSMIATADILKLESLLDTAAPSVRVVGVLWIFVAPEITPSASPTPHPISLFRFDPRWHRALSGGYTAERQVFQLPRRNK